MKKIVKYLIKERGINWYIAVKNMYSSHSDSSYKLHQSIRTCIHYKHDKEYILYHFSWQLSMIKDHAQYQ